MPADRSKMAKKKNVSFRNFRHFLMWNALCKKFVLKCLIKALMSSFLVLQFVGFAIHYCNVYVISRN